MEDSAASIPSIWASMNSWFTPTILFVFLNLMIGTILFTSNLPTNHSHHHTNQEDQKEIPQNDLGKSKLARSPSILNRLRSFNFSPQRSQQDSSPATHRHPHQHQQEEREEEALEIAATEYVFNHPYPHEHDVQPVSTFSDNFDLKSFEKEADAGQYDEFNRTNEVKIANNVQTHFVFEDNHTVEKVTTHFDFGPAGGGSPMGAGVLETHEEEDDELKSLDEVYSRITGGHVNRTKSDTLPASGEVPVKLPAKMKKSASMKSPFSHFEEEKIVEARRPATVRERRSAARATEADDVEVDARADDFINKFKNQLKLQRLDSIIRYKDMVSRGVAK